MSIVSTLLARRLSLRGAHAAALAMCKSSDIEVLSRAGMHLAVLALSSKPSVERALALANSARFPEALEAASRFTHQKKARSLLGLLAVQEPQLVLPLIERQRLFNDIADYCRLMVDGKTRDDNHGSPMLGVVAALRAGHLGLAQQLLSQVYSNAGLTAPQFLQQQQGWDLFTVSCDSATAPVHDGPLISVILTAYNEEKYLPLAVNSILKQSWRQLELIIVDDGSTDSTYSVASQFASQDQRVRVYRCPSNVNTWRAKNMGLSMARGEYVMMHDADDWSHPDKLLLQLQPLLKNRKLMASSSSYFRIDQQTGYPYTRNAASFLRWNPSSLLFRRKVSDDAGIYCEDLLGSDCEFSARLETIWGVNSHRRLRLPLTIGWQRKNSLSNLFRSQELVGKRLLDWESWRKRHLRMVGIEV